MAVLVQLLSKKELTSLDEHEFNILLAVVTGEVLRNPSIQKALRKTLDKAVPEVQKRGALKT